MISGKAGNTPSTCPVLGVLLRVTDRVNSRYQMLLCFQLLFLKNILLIFLLVPPFRGIVCVL